MLLLNHDLPQSYRMPVCDPILTTKQAKVPGQRSLTMQRILPRLEARSPWLPPMDDPVTLMLRAVDQVRAIGSPPLVPTDRRGGKVGLLDLLEGVRVDLLLKHDVGVSDSTSDPIADFGRACERVSKPTKQPPTWECRTPEDVLAMHAYLRDSAAVLGYASVEAVYPPGCEWLAMFNSLEGI